MDKRVSWKAALNDLLIDRGLQVLPEHSIAPPRRRKREDLNRIASDCGFRLAEVSIQVREQSVHASIDFAAMHPAFLGDLTQEFREEVLAETKAKCDDVEKISWAELRFERL